MRIAVFTDSYLPTIDGVVTSIRNAKRQLESMGHEVLVLAPGKSGESGVAEPNTFLCKALGFKRYPGYRIAMFPSAKEIRFLRERGVDIIHSHGVAFMGLKGLWAARELRVPMVLTFHTMLLDALPYYAPFKRKIELSRKLMSLYLRSFLQRCTRVVAPSKAILDELRSIAPTMRMTDVIPNGVDLERFNPDIDGSSIRERWGLDGDALVLYVGRIAQEKNIEVLLDAFPLVRKENRKARLMLVGEGPALGRYKKMTLEKGLENSVIFTGFVPDDQLPKCYAACDAFAIASKFETQGLVVLEAMASGKPVAGVNYRAIPELVENGVNGFLFEPNDIQGCARAILASLEGGEALGRNARTKAEEFSIERCTAKLLRLYEQLLLAPRG